MADANNEDNKKDQEEPQGEHIEVINEEQQPQNDEQAQPQEDLEVVDNPQDQPQNENNQENKKAEKPAPKLEKMGEDAFSQQVEANKQTDALAAKKSELEDRLNQLQQEEQRLEREFDSAGSSSSGNSLAELMQAAYAATKRQVPYLENLREQREIRKYLEELDKKGYEGIHLVDKAKEKIKNIFKDSPKWEPEVAVKDGELDFKDIKIHTGSKDGAKTQTSEEFFNAKPDDDGKVNEKAKERHETFKNNVKAIYDKALEEAGYTKGEDGKYKDKDGSVLTSEKFADINKNLQNMQKDLSSANKADVSSNQTGDYKKFLGQMIVPEEEDKKQPGLK